MGEWKNDAELFQLMREKLYTPVVGDILDAMGCSHQFLPAGIQPLRDDMKLAGRACTVLEQNVFEAQKKPFGLLTEALDHPQTRYPRRRSPPARSQSGSGNPPRWCGWRNPGPSAPWRIRENPAATPGAYPWCSRPPPPPRPLWPWPWR